MTYCANAPPIRGPTTVPTAYILLSIPNHSPLCLRGMTSQITISVKTTIPPPPIPWIARPTRMTPKLWAKLPTRHPARKHSTEKVRTILRPKILDKDPSGGWKTEEHNRKPVPAQKASRPVPPRALEIIYAALASDAFREAGGLTESATAKQVESRATTSVKTHKVEIANLTIMLGLNSGTA